MGSVVVSWKGTCARRGAREEMLGFMEALAERNEARWRSPPKRPAFLEVLTAQRQDTAPPISEIRRFDGEIAGRIVVHLDVSHDEEALAAEAARQGVEVVLGESGKARDGFLKLDRAVLRGLDFRLFDPRGLYPGEDRMSFVFLESEVPCLDGRLVAVTARDRCGLRGWEPIRDADWYLECPFVHLRYYLEEWSDILFAWLKYHFLPDLTYWRYERQPGFETYRSLLEEYRERLGEERARERSFDALLGSFEEHADEWIEKIQVL